MGISILVHGGHGTGKSTFSHTGPGPRLHLDAEGGANWLEGRKVYWTDLSSLPEGITEDTTVIVNVLTAQTLEYAYQWLKSGQHPFKSVTLDSLSEMQKRLVDALVGTNKMQRDDWGTLGRTGEKLVRDIKDLKTHPTNPLESVVFVCASMKKDGEEKWKPSLQGALADSVPFYTDVVAFAQLLKDEEGEYHQHLQILPDDGDGVAKDRTKIISQAKGGVLVDATITELLALTNQVS